MNKKDYGSDLIRGVLDGAVLSVLNREEIYGYEITRVLNEHDFDVLESTIYAVLLRLERNKSVCSTMKKSDQGPARKYYRLTANGREEYKRFWGRWNSLSKNMKELK